MAAVVSAPVVSGASMHPWRRAAGAAAAAEKSGSCCAPSPAPSSVFPGTDVSTEMGSPTPSSLNPGHGDDSDGDSEAPCGDFEFLTIGAESAVESAALAEDERRWRLVGLRMATIFKEAAAGLDVNDF